MAYLKRSGCLNLAHIHRFKSERYPYLLCSSAKNETLGRYDILFSAPTIEFHVDAENKDYVNYFEELNARLKKDAHLDDSTIPTEVPFRGGWFMYLGYELAQQVEPSLCFPDNSYPIGSLFRCASAIIVDHFKNCTYYVCDLTTNLDMIIADADNLIDTQEEYQKNYFDVTISEEASSRYIAGVNKVREYILAGDVFQANLSRLWKIDLEKGTPRNFSHTLFQSLKENNPAPFSASCHFPDFDLISSSPERLLRHFQGRLDTRPIAGTHPRGETEAEDIALAEALFAHGKERAEHIMLIDLERNDLGRVAKVGTVEVDEFMVLETYAHVHHIVSNVTATVRDNIPVGEMLRAVFPGGTITGCPKVRCMEIIQEIEQSARGAYVGSIGYLNHNGDFDTNILIRSFIREGDKLTFRAGGGTVYDSIAENELVETRNKAKGLLKALENVANITYKNKL